MFKYQKKLLKTIESTASKEFRSEEEMIIEVFNALINNEEVKITGGRLWKLNEAKKAYELAFQGGGVAKISKSFVLNIDEYKVLGRISSERTILADETSDVLREKGIFRFSASGLGRRIKINDVKYYEYLLALNSEQIDDELLNTVNVVATVLTSKIKENRLAKSTNRLMEDIDKAKQLQKSILPEHEYKFFNYDLFGVTVAADTLGGDFFDYLRIGEDEDRLGIVVGDAASHGIAAAAEAMYIAGAIRMASMFQIKISSFMNRINQLVNKIFSDDKFTTLFYGEICNDKKGLFLYANAGHNPPIFISNADKTVTYLSPTGPLLGPAPFMKYDTDSVNFDPGDVMVIFSDGIVEAANENEEFYEEERLKHVILENMHKTPRDIAHTILDDVIKFSYKNSKFIDDRTLVVIKRRE